MISREKQFTAEDIATEFRLADNNCQRYFDRMYQTLAFSFAAIIPIVAIGFGLSDKETIEDLGYILFLYVLPICMYFFGTMYLYNAYALATYGKSAECLHQILYSSKKYRHNTVDKILKRYVMTCPGLTLVAYGIGVVFYTVIPGASIWLGCSLFKNVNTLPKTELGILANVLLLLYAFVTVSFIAAIIVNWCQTNKITKELVTVLSQEDDCVDVAFEANDTKIRFSCAQANDINLKSTSGEFSLFIAKSQRE